MRIEQSLILMNKILKSIHDKSVKLDQLSWEPFDLSGLKAFVGDVLWNFLQSWAKVTKFKDEIKKFRQKEIDWIAEVRFPYIYSLFVSALMQ